MSLVLLAAGVIASTEAFYTFESESVRFWVVMSLLAASFLAWVTEHIAEALCHRVGPPGPPGPPGPAGGDYRRHCKDCQ